MRRTIALAISLALLAGLTFAHGNEKHLMGTVIEISPTYIRIQTSAKTPIEVMVTPETKFTKGDAPVTPKDLQVGDRVVIHAMVMEGGKLMAHIVRIGVAKPLQSHSRGSNSSG